MGRDTHQRSLWVGDMHRNQYAIRAPILTYMHFLFSFLSFFFSFILSWLGQNIIHTLEEIIHRGFNESGPIFFSFPLIWKRINHYNLNIGEHFTEIIIFLILQLYTIIDAYSMLNFFLFLFSCKDSNVMRRFCSMVTIHHTILPQQLILIYMYYM